MRILVVDDHALFREAVSVILTRLEGGATVLEAASAEEALRILEHYRDLDMILLDHTMPGLSGVRAIPMLQERAPRTRILVLSASDDTATVRKAIDAGAAGYLPKSSSSHQLLNAVRIVRAGDRYLPARYLDAVRATLPAAMVEPAQGASGLTGRQLQVLELLASGLPNKLIARQLDIAEATVKLHVSAILRELGVRNRTEAVVEAGQRGLLGLSDRA